MPDETEALDNAVEAVEEAMNMLEQIPDDQQAHSFCIYQCLNARSLGIIYFQSTLSFIIHLSLWITALEHPSCDVINPGSLV